MFLAELVSAGAGGGKSVKSGAGRGQAFTSGADMRIPDSAISGGFIEAFMPSFLFKISFIGYHKRRLEKSHKV